HVTVFPNPASEKVVVQLRNPTQVKVELQRLNGQLIQSQEEYGQRFMFEVDDLPKGIYLLQVQSESGARVIRKLVVQ
ncbi:MAG: T9SS type A sorting domain-containing protein, partial [Flavobacteriales bacterium]|nr:T9SS type A sorting domain-containing protein [Flavobacteriales bacterium]